MCLIIQRQPSFEIPYKKFETAILNNPDGYGLSFPGDKGLQVLRSKDKADPEKMYKLINEELIDKHLLIHLRFNTAGDTNLRNTHPFPVLERNTDGIDLRMAHNGTLYKYKNKAHKGESDTRCFVREFIRPLFKRLIKGMDTVDILKDPFVKELLEDQLSASSILSFIDGEGNTLNCNAEGAGGKQEEGWYYSNTYSFNEAHRVKPTTNGVKSGPATVHPIGTAKKATRMRTFTEIFKVKDVTELLYLTDETITGIVNAKMPAEFLIKQLLFEMDKLLDRNLTLTHVVKSLKEKMQ
jgi:hypothetical protein